MTRAECEAAARARLENQTVDFKAPVPWRDACFKAGLLADIAAYANTKGGIIIIGRDEPNYTTGSLSAADLATYDVTALGTHVHANVAPKISLEVHYLDIDGASLVAVAVEPLVRSIAIFMNGYGCTTPTHNHQRAGDVYVRTIAAQTVRLASYPEMEELFEKVVSTRLSQRISELRALGLI